VLSHVIEAPPARSGTFEFHTEFLSNRSSPSPVSYIHLSNSLEGPKFDVIVGANSTIWNHWLRALSIECASNNYNRRRNQNANISYKAANPRFAEGQWDEVVSKLQVEKPLHRDNLMLRAGVYAILAFCYIIARAGGASAKDRSLRVTC
jgi:hypothetical protein